ncbi:4570_t:CDS:2, partial [Funneliformis geosporum]
AVTAGGSFDPSDNKTYDEEFGEKEWGEEEWGDDEDSGWDDDDDTEKIQNLKNKDFKLAWKKDSKLEKTKRGRYMTGKIPRSSYYEKYGPTGLFTKAAVNTKKITNFFKINDQAANVQLNEIEQISSDSEDE